MVREAAEETLYMQRACGGRDRKPGQVWPEQWRGQGGGTGRHFARGGLWPGKPGASRSLVQLKGKGVDTTGGRVPDRGAQTSHLCPLCPI